MRSKPLTLLLALAAASALLALGCGGDGDAVSLEDVTAPADQAREALEGAPETIEDAVQQCIDSAESSGLPSDQVDSLKQLCESGGDAAGNALETAPGG